MNKIYKVIWSKVRNCYVAVSEIAKRNGKSCTSVNCGAKVNRGHAGVAPMVCAALLAGVFSVLLPVRITLAAPVMPTLDYRGATADVTIASTSSNTAPTMNITSTKQNNVLKWIDFSIGSGGTVNFNDNKNYLNYVTGHGRSEIYGTLTGGGDIYLINPNGILIGNGAVVNVGNLYLSGKSLTEEQINGFANNGTSPININSTINGTADVINLGTLSANSVIVEGNNITFKNVADVTVTNNVTVLSKYSDASTLKIGYANSQTASTTVNTTDYTTINQPNLDNWLFKYYSTSISKNTVPKYMLVRNKYELQNMNNKRTGNYILASDIDCSGLSFTPVGNASTKFSGNFEGLGFKIKNLTINLPEEDYVGLFGYVGDSGSNNIANFGIVGGTVIGRDKVGAVIGEKKYTHVYNVYNENVNVSGRDYVGGIIGNNYKNAIYRPLEIAYNTGTIKGRNYVGGIAGDDYDNREYVSRNLFNTGPVEATGDYVGGISGRGGYPYDVYNTGNIKGTNYVGGIIGDGRVNRAYNTGSTTGTNNVGAVVGTTTYSSSSAFFSNGTNNGVGTQVEASALMKASTFEGFSIDKDGGDNTKPKWRIYEGYTTPMLKAFLKQKDVVAVLNYNGQSQSIPANSSLFNDGKIKSGEISSWDTTSRKDAGSQDFSSKNKSYFYSTQDGYDIVDMKLIVQPKKLTATFANISKEYDGNTTATAGTKSLAGKITGDTVNFEDGITGAFTDKNVGTNKDVIYSNIALTGASAENYIVADTATGNGTINKRVLTASFDAISKTYDGTTNDVDAEGAVIASRTGTLSNVVEGEENKVSVTGVATYTDENASDSNITVSYGNLALVAGIAGDGTSNYMLSDASVTGNGTIAARLVTLSGTINKVYDRTNTATPTVDALSNVIAADKAALTISATSATFSDVNVGNDLTVTYEGLQLGGTKAGNYSLEATDATVLNNSITQRDVTLTGTISKVYDGTTAAIPSAGSLSDVIGEDLEDLDLLATSASFDNKNVGENNRTITYEGLTLSGEKAPNYRLTNTSATKEGNTIIPKELALVADKVRIKKGGTPPTTFTGNLTGFVPSEELNPADRSKLSFTASVLDTTTAGSYAIIGTFNGQESGTYRINDSEPYNYTFKNAISNNTAFTIFTDMLPKLDLKGASAYVTIDDTTANTMVISSTQEYNVLKWIDFSIDSGGTVKYDAKNYLNFVTGHGRSEVYGTLTGDGNIYLINPNGILFGSDAQVDVGNLYLSTRNLTTTQLADYTTGVAALYKNDNAAIGDIINLGRLDADLIKAEGRNISFKNIADVTKGGTLTDGVITGGTAHNEAANGSVTLTVNNVEADPEDLR